MTFDDLTGSLPSLLSKAKNVLVAGTAKHIVVKNAKGTMYADVPVTVAVIVTILVPVITGFAAIAALVLGFTVSVDPRSSESQTLRIRNRPAPRE